MATIFDDDTSNNDVVNIEEEEEEEELMIDNGEPLFNVEYNDDGIE